MTADPRNGRDKPPERRKGDEGYTAADRKRDRNLAAKAFLTVGTTTAAVIALPSGTTAQAQRPLRGFLGPASRKGHLRAVSQKLTRTRTDPIDTPLMVPCVILTCRNSMLDAQAAAGALHRSPVLSWNRKCANKKPVSTRHG